MRVYEVVYEPCVEACGYFAELKAKFRYFHIEDCTNSFYLHLLERGWRRFGKEFLVPICEGCEACISIRYDCENFVFSKSHKRILKSPITLEIKRPWVSEAHISLHDKYHHCMHFKKGWKYRRTTPQYYYETFVESFLDFGYEFDYYFEDKLIGVAYVDIIDTEAISALYCYYDHDFSQYSIGTYSILKQIEIAKEYNIKYLYPGYWIKNHISMGYKERFKPFEILCNRPSLEEIPLWVKE